MSKFSPVFSRWHWRPDADTIKRWHFLSSSAAEMFVCFVFSRLSNFSAIHYRWLGCKYGPMLGTQGLWAGRDLYRATPTATRGLGLYGLIRKTGTHVPQWGSNPLLKDHQIFEPDVLTTAPRGRLEFYCKLNDTDHSPVVCIGHTLGLFSMYSMCTKSCSGIHYLQYSESYFPLIQVAQATKRDL
jgi:hypothetical protein